MAKSKAAVARRQTSSPPTPSPKVAPKRPDDQLNVVLDKISEHGLDSLTSDERRILEEMSKKLKGPRLSGRRAELGDVKPSGCHSHQREASRGFLICHPEKRAPRTCRGAGAATPFSRRRWPAHKHRLLFANLRRGTNSVHSRASLSTHSMMCDAHRESSASPRSSSRLAVM